METIITKLVEMVNMEYFTFTFTWYNHSVVLTEFRELYVALKILQRDWHAGMCFTNNLQTATANKRIAVREVL